MTIRLTQPESENDWRRARKLIEEYAATLNMDLSFQSFEREMNNLAVDYDLPGGALLVAEDKGIYVGCVGLRRFSNGIGEIKRLYVMPTARVRGIGRTLAEGIVAKAKVLGYSRLFLDTLPSMKVAQSLYLSLGFKPISAYRFNPVPGTAYMELEL